MNAPRVDMPYGVFRCNDNGPPGETRFSKNPEILAFDDVYYMNQDGFRLCTVCQTLCKRLYKCKDCLKIFCNYPYCSNGQAYGAVFCRLHNRVCGIPNCYQPAITFRNQRVASTYRCIEHRSIRYLNKQKTSQTKTSTIKKMRKQRPFTYNHLRSKDDNGKISRTCIRQLNRILKTRLSNRKPCARNYIVCKRYGAPTASLADYLANMAVIKGLDYSQIGTTHTVCSTKDLQLYDLSNDKHLSDVFHYQSLDIKSKV